MCFPITYTRTLTGLTLISVWLSENTNVNRKQPIVRTARTLNEYAKIAFPRDKTVCIFDAKCATFGVFCEESKEDKYSIDQINQDFIADVCKSELTCFVNTFLRIWEAFGKAPKNAHHFSPNSNLRLTRNVPGLKCFNVFVFSIEPIRMFSFCRHVSALPFHCIRLYNIAFLCLFYIS